MYVDVYIPSKELYIEIFGMSDLDFYKIKMLKKISNYKQMNLSLLELYKKDFNSTNKFKNKILEKIK